MDTKTLGRIYFHTAYCAPDVPVFHTAETNEIEEPFRYGKGLVFRFPLTRRVIVIGRWVGERSETEAMDDVFSRQGGLNEIKGDWR